jgi:retron-type reverse transcriptase
VAEQFSLLPKEQMGFRSNRSTESALDLLVSQIQEVQKSKSYVATLLSFDISGAFDSVVPERLIDILRRKGFPLWLLSFIASFSTSRSTTVLLPSGEESELRDIGNGLPQGSPLSVILFILYNSSLFNIFRRYKIGISSIGFADDLNALAYSTSTEQNCRQLEALHKEALEWAKKHGISFAPNKYELIYFSRARSRFNLQASIKLSDLVTKELAKEVRVLGIWLDSKLSWGPHIRRLYDKGT